MNSSSGVGNVPRSRTVSVVAQPDQRDTTSTLFPARYAIDMERIADEMTMQDLGLSKPTPNERIIAAKVNAIIKRDFETGGKIQDQMERCNEHNRRVRSAKKVRCRLIAAKIGEKDCPDEPNSGDEGGSGVALHKCKYCQTLERFVTSARAAC